LPAERQAHGLDRVSFRTDPDGYRIEIIEQPTVAQTRG